MTNRKGKCLIATALVALCVCGCDTGSPIEEEALSDSSLPPNHVPPDIRVPSTNPFVSPPFSGVVPGADVISDVTGSASPDINVTDSVSTSITGTPTNTAPTSRTTTSGPSGRDIAAGATRKDNASGNHTVPTSTSGIIPTSTKIPGSDSVPRYTATSTDVPDDVTTSMNDDPFFGDSFSRERLLSPVNSSTISPSHEPSNSPTDNSFITSSDSPFSISDDNSPKSREDGVFAPAADTSSKDTPVSYSPQSLNPSQHPSPENTSPLPASSLSPPPPTSPASTTTPSPAPVVKRCCPKGFRMASAGCVGDNDTQPLYNNGTGQNDFFECKNGNAWNKSKSDSMIKGSADLVILSPMIVRRAGNFCLEEAVGDDGSDLSVYYLCYTDPVEEYNKHCNEPTSCVRKCCPEEHVLRRGRCVHHEQKLKLGIVDYSLDAIESESEKTVISEFPACVEGQELAKNRESERKFFVMESGNLYTPEDHNNYLSYDNYCVDYELDDHKNLSRVVFSCYDKGKIPSQWKLLAVYFRTAGLIISSVFLFITLVFYFCITELRNLQGLTLLSHVASLFISQLALLVLNWLPSAPPRGLCVSTGFAVQLFFLWSFFWLNVICFDIWRYVGLSVNMVVMTGRGSGGSKGCKGGIYLWYMLYAWGIPLLIFFVSLILFLLPGGLHGFLRPSFIHGKCWLSRDMEMLAFFYGPVAVLFLVNLVLIMHTGLRLYRAGGMFACCTNRCCPDRSSAAATSHTFNRSHLQEFWQRFGIFSVMAICWIFEILSWKIPPLEAWAFTDTLNSLQGFFVFILFMGNKQKRALVGELLRRWRKKVNICWRNKATLGRQGTFYVTDETKQMTRSFSDDIQLQDGSIPRVSTGQTELSLNDSGLDKGPNEHKGVRV